VLFLGLFNDALGYKPKLCWSLSPWTAASSGCEWRRRPPDTKGSREYTE